MSNEARLQMSLQIARGKLVYQSKPTAFTADVDAIGGPTPGTITVATAGTDVSLAALTSYGGWCRIQNLDDTNFVTFGVESGGTFYGLGELLPGEMTILRLSRRLLYGPSGTAVVRSLRIVADAAPCLVLVEAFDA